MHVDVLKRQLEIASKYAMQRNFKGACSGIFGVDLFFDKTFNHYHKDRINSYQAVSDSYYKKIIKTNIELNKALKFRVDYKIVKDFLTHKFFKDCKQHKAVILPEINMLSNSIFIELGDLETASIFTYGLLVTRLSTDTAEIKIFSYHPEKNEWRWFQPAMFVGINLINHEPERGSFFVETIAKTEGMVSMLDCLLTYGQDKSNVDQNIKDYIESIKTIIEHFSRVAVEVLQAASSREVTIKSVTEKKTVPRVGKSKKGKRKVTSITYNVIDFPLEEEVHLLTNAGGGTKHATHASPRQHTRIGHWRKCRTKSVWIEPTVVGKAENGTVDKEYRVVRKAITIKRVNNETNNPELSRS